MNSRNLKKYLVRAVVNKTPVLVLGAPGIGKTDIALSVVDELNKSAKKTEKWEMMITHPCISDPTDYKGLPFKADNDTAKFLPYESLARMINAKTNLLVLIDDLIQAPPSVQAPLMQLLLAREVDGKKISDKVSFVLCSNRATDRAGGTMILDPLIKRAVVIDLEPTVEDWCNWAFDNNIGAEWISFMRFKPDMLVEKSNYSSEIKNTANPRTITRAIREYAQGLDGEIEFEVLKGCAGEVFATQALAFMKNYNALKDYNIDDLITNQEKVKIPTEISITYALCGAIINKLGTLTEKTVEKGITNVVQFVNRIGQSGKAEFGVMVMNDIVDVIRRKMTSAKAEDKSIAKSILANKELKAWLADKNNAELVKGI